MAARVQFVRVTLMQRLDADGNVERFLDSASFGVNDPDAKKEFGKLDKVMGSIPGFVAEKSGMDTLLDAAVLAAEIEAGLK